MYLLGIKIFEFIVYLYGLIFFIYLSIALDQIVKQKSTLLINSLQDNWILGLAVVVYVSTILRVPYSLIVTKTPLTFLLVYKLVYYISLFSIVAFWFFGIYIMWAFSNNVFNDKQSIIQASMVIDPSCPFLNDPCKNSKDTSANCTAPSFDTDPIVKAWQEEQCAGYSRPELIEYPDLKPQFLTLFLMLTLGSVLLIIYFFLKPLSV